MKLFKSFQVIYPMNNQFYKLESAKQQKMYDIFYIFLLKLDITSKGQINEEIIEQLKFKVNSNDKEYKVKSIYNNVIYAKEFKIGHASGLYYPVPQKSYTKNKRT